MDFLALIRSDEAERIAGVESLNWKNVIAY